MGAKHLLVSLAFAACAFLPSPTGVSAAASRLSPGPNVAACARFLPTDGTAVTLRAWRPDAASGVMALRTVGASRIAVESRPDAWLIYLEDSQVMRTGLYLDRASGALAMPGIVAVDTPKHISGGCEWAARETYALETVKLGSVAVTALGAPGRCSLAARFRKVVRGKALVDEDFVADYACGRTP